MPSPRERTVPITGLRLAAGFLCLLLLFVAALVVCLTSLANIAAADRQVETLERTRRAADRAAVLMREQYIHQAHTLIYFDDSHLGHYREVEAEARKAVADLSASLTSEEDAPLAERLEQLRLESDSIFIRQTVPAVLRGDRVEAQRLHEQAAASVEEFSEVVGQVHGQNEARSATARALQQRAWTQARWLSITCFGIAVAVAIIVAVAMTTTLTRRIAILLAGTSKLGEGNLTARVALNTKDELGDLARAVNQMAEDLERHQRELVRSQRLASIGHVATTVAHELNNPLGVILGYAKVLRRRQEHDPDSLRVIEEEATLASGIVATLLDLARPQSLRLGDVDVAALAIDSMRRLEHIDAFRGIAWNNRSEVRAALVRGDEARLRQVMTNLLTNAAQAAAPTGRVELRIEEYSTVVRLTVDDSGPGISEEARTKLTEPFYTTKAEGIGLGLSIVQAVVEAHHGTVHFERSALGGALVRVELPAMARGGAT